MTRWNVKIFLIIYAFINIFPTLSFADEISGSISNLSVSSQNINAGQNISVTFSVSLSSNPSSPIPWQVWVGATPDENGDPWTSGNWTSPAQLISGDQQNGVWRATVNIPSSAYTGDYQAGTILVSKLISTAGQLANFHINGVQAPIIVPISGTISNFTSASSTFLAGSTYDFYFDVNLNNYPNNSIVYFGCISGAPDINGDSWTQDQWCNKPTLVSGDTKNGHWRTSITIADSAVTGDYIFSAGQSVSKLIVSGGNFLKFKVAGSAPLIKIIPTYNFSNYFLSANRILRGSNITAKFHVTSNDQTVGTPECVIDGVAPLAFATKLSGTNLDGDWQCTFSISTNILSGNYDFHVIVTGYANKEKNDNRIVLPFTVVNTVSELINSNVNTVYLDTVRPINTDQFTYDLNQPITNIKTDLPVGRFLVSPGSGVVTVTIIGPTLIGLNQNKNTASKILSFTRNPNNSSFLYLFSDFTYGVASVNFNFGANSINKNIILINNGATASPNPSPSATSTSSSNQVNPTQSNGNSITLPENQLSFMSTALAAVSYNEVAKSLTSTAVTVQKSAKATTAKVGSSFTQVISTLPAKTVFKTLISLSGQYVSGGVISSDSSGVAKLPTLKGKTAGTYLITLYGTNEKIYYSKITITKK